MMDVGDEIEIHTFVCIAIYVQLNIKTKYRPCVYNPCTLESRCLPLRKDLIFLLQFINSITTYKFLGGEGGEGID